MIIYEVTTEVRDDLCAAYEQYMTDQHISDVMATGKFQRALFEESTPGRYRIRYEAESRAILDSYLAEDARRLRKDLTEHFPEGIGVSREEWTVVREFA